MSTDDETGTGQPGEPKAVDENEAPEAIIGDAIQRATHAYLKDRFGLQETDDGMLEFPDNERYKDLGPKAETFIQGLFKGFVDAGDAARDGSIPVTEAARQLQPASERVLDLLGTMSQTLRTTFKTYVAEHRHDATQDGDKTVVDGAFVLRHGAPLVGEALRALGDAFSKPAAGTGPPEAPPPSDAPDVDYRVDFVDVLKALFVPKRPISVPVPDPRPTAADRTQQENSDDADR